MLRPEIVHSGGGLCRSPKTGGHGVAGQGKTWVCHNGRPQVLIKMRHAAGGDRSANVYAVATAGGPRRMTLEGYTDIRKVRGSS